MGQGVVESVAREITRQMTRCLESKLLWAALRSWLRRGRTARQKGRE
jgi:hypothetical protein